MSEHDILTLRLVSRNLDQAYSRLVITFLTREVHYYGSPYLNRAAATCQHSGLRALLSAGVSPTQHEGHNQNGETALHAAARSGCLVAVQEPLSAGAKVDAKARHGWTALQLAARCGPLEALRELIAAGAELDRRGFHGWTALHYAVREGHMKDIVKMLVDAGGNGYFILF